MNEKKAVISVDVEDWYHLDYFKNKKSSTYSMMDGLNTIRKVLDEFSIPSSYFILSDIINSHHSDIYEILKYEDDIGVHGTDHTRPLLQSKEEFRNDLHKAISIIENASAREINGYRAPCFSLDRDRLDIVINSKIKFDSSYIQFSNHPLYGKINLNNFIELEDGISRIENFFEFEVSTVDLFNKKLPISGGGYLRILPRQLFVVLLKKYLKKNSFYNIFLHPFEFSSKIADPNDIKNLSFINKFRFLYNIERGEERLRMLIQILLDEGYSFTTYKSIREGFLDK